MIINSKQNCITDLIASIKRTACWRRQLQAKFNDPRNGLAADRLDQIATGIEDLTDEAWSKLMDHYSWSSGRWSDAVSTTSRQVGFRGVNDLPTYLNCLVGLLSQCVAA